jgi:putative endonuclease
MSQWYVYMVRASDQSLYTGITTDLERRLEEHQSGSAGAKYFRGRSAIEMVYSERADNRSAASVREAAIKKLPRAKKLALVNNCPKCIYN